MNNNMNNCSYYFRKIGIPANPNNPNPTSEIWSQVLLFIYAASSTLSSLYIKTHYQRLLVADEAPKPLSIWLRENMKHIWGGDLGKITYKTMTEFEYTEGVNLREIHACAWNGIIPKGLVKLVQKLLSNSKHWAPKNGCTANNIVGRINGLTNKAMCSVWEKRKEKLEEENTTSTKSKPQSILDQAKALADAGLLPGIGGVGKMTYTEFGAPPKKQRSNKMQKVPRETWTILKISL
jgi:hypothetical protein